MLSADVRRDFIYLLSSRASTRIGDGFLRILSILLVAEKSHDPLIAGLVLVFRYFCEVIINAVSGPFIDKIHIRISLMASDLIRAVLALLLVGAVLLGYPYPVYLALSFLGDFVFIFFKPAVDKVVKVSFPVREGTKVLSEVDAVNHLSNIGGYALASLVASWLGLQIAVFMAPVFFLFSFVMVSRLKLSGETVIDYAKVRKKSYWASQKEGMRFTLRHPLLRLLLVSRSAVAVGRGAFTALSVFYVADMAKGLSSYGYFESAQSAGKVVATALIIPFIFAYRSNFLLMGISMIMLGISFFCFNLVHNVMLACFVGALVGLSQAAEAVAVDACINRYAGAHIQARTKSTTSFGSRLAGLAAIGGAYFGVTYLHVSARTLFAWLCIFPFLGAATAVAAWLIEKPEQAGAMESAKDGG